MKSIAKAILGGIISALSFAAPVVDDGLTPSEVLGIMLAGLVAFGAVWGVKNAPADHDEAGAGEVLWIAVAALVLAVLAIVGVRIDG